MRSLMMILIMVAGMFVGGCDLLMLQKEDAIKTTTAIESLSAKLDVVQDGMTQWAEVSGKYGEEIKNINEDIDAYQDTLIEAKKAFDEAPTVMEGLIEANKTSAPLNPYAPYIDIILNTIAGVVVGGGVVKVASNKTIAKSKAECENERLRYKACKKGLEALRMKHPESYEENYKLVGTHRRELGVG